jgi:tetratricopeptide (TPR) repeat protein
MKGNFFATYIIGPLILIAVLGTLYFFYNSASDSELTEAYQNYLQGEKSQTVNERKETFNNALKNYLEIEKKYDSEYSSGKLYYNIGDTYYQLEEYPLAAYYFYRAQALRPNDAMVRRNLETTLKKLDLTLKESKSPFRILFFFHNNFSLPTRLQFFSLLLIATFAMISANIWRPSNKLKAALYVFEALLVIMCLSLLFTRYLTTPEGVVVHSTPLYRDAGRQFAQVTPKPVSAGEKVEVLDVLNEGLWIKIKTPEGDLGYIPSDKIKVIPTT